MDCIILLLLLSCFGGIGCNNAGTSNTNNGGCGNTATPFGNGNNIGRSSMGSDNDCGCSNNGVPAAGSGGCDGGDGISTVSGGPSHWQDYPGIPGRENNCDCED